MQWAADMPVQFIHKPGTTLVDADYFSRLELLNIAEQPRELLDAISAEAKLKIVDRIAETAGHHTLSHTRTPQETAVSQQHPCLARHVTIRRQGRTLEYNRPTSSLAYVCQMMSPGGNPLQMPDDPMVSPDPFDGVVDDEDSAPFALQTANQTAQQSDVWTDMMFDTVDRIVGPSRLDIAKHQKEDAYLGYILKQCCTQQPIDHNKIGVWAELGLPVTAWHVQHRSDGAQLLFCGARVPVPTRLHAAVLHEAHTKDMASHRTTNQMLPWLNRMVWPKMEADARRFVEACAQCKLVQQQRAVITQAGKVQSRLFETVQIDIAENVGPTTTKPKQPHALVAVCKLSRYAFIEPLSATSAAECVRAMCRIIPVVGTAAEFELDQGKSFVSKEFVEMASDFGIRLRFGSAGHKGGQSLVENRIKVLRKWARSLNVAGKLSNWPRLLYQLLMQMHNQPFVHKQTDGARLLTPHLMVFGRDMPHMPLRMLGEQLSDLDRVWDDELAPAQRVRDAGALLAHHDLLQNRAQQRTAATTPSAPLLQVGDIAQVARDLPPVGHKTEPKYDFPYRVLEVHRPAPDDPLRAVHYVLEHQITKARVKRHQSHVKLWNTVFQSHAQRREATSLTQIHDKFREGRKRLAADLVRAAQNYQLKKSQIPQKKRRGRHL